MQIKKRAKKNTKRRSATRRGKPKPLPTWVMLGIGLVTGVIFVLLIQLVISRTGQPGSGFHNLLNAAKQSQNKHAQQDRVKVKKAKTAKPNFNFYTILPEIETVVTESDVKKLPPGKTTKDVRYILQAGSFSRFQDADRLKASLVLNGLSARIQKVTIEGRGQFHRVRLGPFASLSSLESTNQKLKQMGIRPYLLKVKSKEPLINP